MSNGNGECSAFRAASGRSVAQQRFDKEGNRVYRLPMHVVKKGRLSGMNPVKKTALLKFDFNLFQLPGDWRRLTMPFYHQQDPFARLRLLWLKQCFVAVQATMNDENTDQRFL